MEGMEGAFVNLIFDEPIRNNPPSPMEPNMWASIMLLLIFGFLAWAMVGQGLFEVLSRWCRNRKGR